MAIYYGVCDDFAGYRVNIGRSMLSCGQNVLFFSSGMSGEAVRYKAAIMPPDQYQDVICAEEFFTRSVSMNTRLNNNPLFVGCCTDATSADPDTLLDTCIGGMSISTETSLSVNGQGNPEAFNDCGTTGGDRRSDIGDVMIAAANLVAPGENWGDAMVPSGTATWIQSGVNFDMSLNSWNSGSISWTTFAGLGIQMIREESGGHGIVRADRYSYNVSLDASTGMIDAQQTVEAYESHSDETNCTPVTVTEVLCDFTNQISTSFNT